MARKIVYHNDGSIRMDWLTFQSLPSTRIVAAIRERTVLKPKHTLLPTSGSGGVKEFL